MISPKTNTATGAVPGESEEKVFEFDRCVRQRPQRFPSSSLRSSVEEATPKQDPFSGDVFKIHPRLNIKISHECKFDAY